MNASNLTNWLWGKRAHIGYLLLASVVLLFTALGSREIWTQEHRWADIVFGMFYRHDFLHPYLGEATYYDKPLLSYWLMAITAWLMNGLTTWALRIPSALAGVLAIWSIYRIGNIVKDKQMGLVAGWLLLTTFYFVFWARVSSADMLNLGGTFFAIAWYMAKRERPSFVNFAIFFIILALTALCKGLIGVIIPGIAILVDLILRKSWRPYLSLSLVFALLPAIVIYLLPFMASSYVDGDAYGQNGLYLVYRENILRFFEPFDHQGPVYTYFIWLPIYLLPCTAFFFFAAVMGLVNRWKAMTRDAKWIVWTTLAIFTFLTISGSRRNYYVLPLVPFACLLAADWVVAKGESAKRYAYAGVAVVFAYVFLFLAVDVLPGWYYSNYGINQFATLVQQDATALQPWQSWNVVMLDAESKLSFYLKLPPSTKYHEVTGKRQEQTSETLLQAWPMLRAKEPNTIFITRKIYAPMLQTYLPGYHIVEVLPPSFLSFLNHDGIDIPVAFIPNTVDVPRKK